MLFSMKKKVVNIPQPTWPQDNGNEVDLMKWVSATHVAILPEIFVKRKLECNNLCEDDTILEPKSSDFYAMP